MKYIFNYQKYVAWRMKYDKLTLDDICLLNRFTDMSKLNGKDRNTIKDLIILKAWCDETEG